jgi:sortase A
VVYSLVMQRDWRETAGFSWLEYVALVGTCLIWAGVGLISVGLYLTYRDLQAESQVVAVNGSPNVAVVLKVTEPPTSTPPAPTPTPLPSPTVPVATSSPGAVPVFLPESPDVPPVATAQVTPPIPRTTHVVQKGESLWSIAKHYGLDVDVLTTANGLSRSAVIHPGDVLFIPRPDEAILTSTPPPTSTTYPVATPTETPVPVVMPATATPYPVATPAAEVGKPPTRLVIPAIGLDAPVVPVGWKMVKDGDSEYAVWEVADYAVGWHKSSAYPGQPGNTVLAGHHNIKGEIFRYLVNLEPGAEVTLYAGETPYRYRVIQKMILKEKGMPEEVRLKNAQWIAPTEDERLTMVTCWPYTNNTHRVIVVAKPVTEQ